MRRLFNLYDISVRFGGLLFIILIQKTSNQTHMQKYFEYKTGIRSVKPLLSVSSNYCVLSNLPTSRSWPLGKSTFTIF